MKKTEVEGKSNFDIWWEKTKKENPRAAEIDAGVASVSTGVAGALCIGNSLKYFAKGNVVLPIIQLTVGLGLVAYSARAATELKKIRESSILDSEEE